MLVDTLQHHAPLPDGALGGDSRVDIYVRTPAQIGDVYGATFPETNVGTPYPGSYTAWVEIVDTLSVARRTTVTAHEIYHVIQVAYDRFESVSLLEMLSTWVEDRLYDDYNLNLATLNLFFRWPYRGLFNQVYTNVPWAIYLTQLYGDDILPQTLLACATTPGPNPRDAFDQALVNNTATNFADAFVAFGVYNLFTGGRDDGLHYEEGATYRAIGFEDRDDCYPTSTFVSLRPLAELGANYYHFDGDQHDDPLALRFIPAFQASMYLTLVRYKGGVWSASTEFYPVNSPEDQIVISDWKDVDSLVVICQINTGGADNAVGIRASHITAAAPAGDWVLVVDRDGCRAPFDGVEDDFTTRDGEEAGLREALVDAGATVVVSDSIPPSLAGCVAVFVSGAFDAGGCTLSDDMLNKLMFYLDGGGDVYVEGSELGSWIDPGQGAGDATEHAFWSNFGCTFKPGLPTGNVASWSTVSSAYFSGDYAFGYDGGEPNDWVGVLKPVAGASPLVEDQAGNVRATLQRGPNNSYRVMATMLIGGSRETAGSTRGQFMNAVLMAFGLQLSTLSVTRAEVSVEGVDVRITGALEHYDGEQLEMVRVAPEGTAGIQLTVTPSSRDARFSASDRLPGDAATYRLVDVTHQRVLWEQSVRARVPAYSLALVSVFPNPARDDVRLLVDSASDHAAMVRVYDVAGRRVDEQPVALRRGTNTLFLRTPRGSGHFYVRIDAGDRHVTGRFSVIR